MARGPHATSSLLSSGLDYDIKKLIIMQKSEPRAVGLKPTKNGYVDRVIVPSTT